MRNTGKGRSGQGVLSRDPVFSLRTDCQKGASQGRCGERSGRGNSKCVDSEVRAGMEKQWVWLGVKLGGDDIDPRETVERAGRGGGGGGEQALVCVRGCWGTVLQEEATGLDDEASQGGKGVEGDPWGFDPRDWWVMPCTERWRKTGRNRFKGGASCGHLTCRGPRTVRV